jgi:hypothetical protein
MAKINMTKKKIISVALFAIIGTAVFFTLYYQIRPYWESWQMGYKYEKFEKGLVDYFKNDTFGGKTPEETYNLYVSALKKGDLELASKYFYWRKQVEQKNKLEDLKNKGELEKYIADLPGWGELKEEGYSVSTTKKYNLLKYRNKPVTIKAPNGTGGFIEVISPPGDYVAFSVDFELNEQASIWKIYSL